MSKTLFIVNPKAGGQRAGRLWQNFAELLPSIMKDYEVIITEAPGQGELLALKHTELGTYDALISCGGDGTLNEIINGYCQSPHKSKNVAIGVIPIGSGNDYSRAWNFPKKPKSLLEIIAKKKIKSVKVGKVEFADFQGSSRSRYFCNIFSFGLSGLAGSLINNSPKPLGPKVAYLYNTLKAVMRYHGDLVTIKADNQVIFSGTVTNAVIAIGKYFGNGLKIAPQAEFIGNELDSIIVPEMTKGQVIAKLPKLVSGTHINDPEIVLHKGKSFTAESNFNQNIFIDIDGEAVGHLPVKVNICEFSLPMIVP